MDELKQIENKVEPALFSKPPLLSGKENTAPHQSQRPPFHPHASAPAPGGQYPNQWAQPVSHQGEFSNVMSMLRRFNHSMGAPQRPQAVYNTPNNNEVRIITDLF